MFQYYSWIIVQTTDTHPASFDTGPCLIFPEGVNERNDSNKTAKADFVHVQWQQHQNCHLVKSNIPMPTVLDRSQFQRGYEVKIMHILEEIRQPFLSPFPKALWDVPSSLPTSIYYSFSLLCSFSFPASPFANPQSFSHIPHPVDSGEAWLLPNDA